MTKELQSQRLQQKLLENYVFALQQVMTAALGTYTSGFELRVMIFFVCAFAYSAYTTTCMFLVHTPYCVAYCVLVLLTQEPIFRGIVCNKKQRNFFCTQLGNTGNTTSDTSKMLETYNDVATYMRLSCVFLIAYIVFWNWWEPSLHYIVDVNVSWVVLHKPVLLDVILLGVHAYCAHDTQVKHVFGAFGIGILYSVCRMYMQKQDTGLWCAGVGFALAASVRSSCSEDFEALSRAYRLCLQGTTDENDGGDTDAVASETFIVVCTRNRKKQDAAQNAAGMLWLLWTSSIEVLFWCSCNNISFDSIQALFCIAPHVMLHFFAVTLQNGQTLAKFSGTTSASSNGFQALAFFSCVWNVGYHFILQILKMCGISSESIDRLQQTLWKLQIHEDNPVNTLVAIVIIVLLCSTCILLLQMLAQGFQGADAFVQSALHDEHMYMFIKALYRSRALFWGITFINCVQLGVLLKMNMVYHRGVINVALMYVLVMLTIFHNNRQCHWKQVSNDGKCDEKNSAYTFSPIVNEQAEVVVSSDDWKKWLSFIWHWGSRIQQNAIMQVSIGVLSSCFTSAVLAHATNALGPNFFHYFRASGNIPYAITMLPLVLLWTVIQIYFEIFRPREAENCGLMVPAGPNAENSDAVVIYVSQDVTQQVCAQYSRSKIKSSANLPGNANLSLSPSPAAASNNAYLKIFEALLPLLWEQFLYTNDGAGHRQTFTVNGEESVVPLCVSPVQAGKISMTATFADASIISRVSGDINNWGQLFLIALTIARYGYPVSKRVTKTTSKLYLAGKVPTKFKSARAVYDRMPENIYHQRQEQAKADIAFAFHLQLTGQTLDVCQVIDLMSAAVITRILQLLQQETLEAQQLRDNVLALFEIHDNVPVLLHANFFDRVYGILTGAAASAAS